MGKLANAAIFGFVMSIIFTAPVDSRARARDCGESIVQYNLAAKDVVSSLRRYANCISNSQARDDCSMEFIFLQSAQRDFDSAVSDYRRFCR